jgi:hypothetical protein
LGGFGIGNWRLAFEQPPPVLIGFVLDHSALVELMQRARIIELRLIEFAAEATARAT